MRHFRASSFIGSNRQSRTGFARKPRYLASKPVTAQQDKLRAVCLAVFQFRVLMLSVDFALPNPHAKAESFKFDRFPLKSNAVKFKRAGFPALIQQRPQPLGYLRCQLLRILRRLCRFVNIVFDKLFELRFSESGAGVAEFGQRGQFFICIA